MRISFVIPVNDEEGSLRELVSQIDVAAQDLGNYEIILVDDGSEDGSWGLINELSAVENVRPIVGIRLRRNAGKALALAAGFRHASGGVVITMDADLQDDPKEIPRFLEKLNEGYDLVSGWKRQRHDPMTKTWPSRIFNWITARLTGVKLHDFNCGFKCYRKEVIDKLSLYGELHRFVPVFAADLGFRVGEIVVEHHERTHGRSKYGWERYSRGLVDLVTVLATTRWLHKPGHLFGGLGLILGLLGGGILAYLTVLWFLGLGPIGNRPLLILGVMLCIFSLQMLSLGVIAEFFIKVNRSEEADMLISEFTGNVVDPAIVPDSAGENNWSR